MKRDKVGKALALGIVFLIVFIGFQPAFAIDVNDVNDKGELVEITTEVCGMDDVEQITVRLTKQELKELENLFDSIKEQLEFVETEEEAVDIFNDAILELDKYGLFGSLSIEQVKDIVYERYNHPNVRKISNILKLYNKYLGNFDDNENFLCLIAGRTSHTIFREELMYSWIAEFFSFAFRMLFWLLPFPTFLCSISLGEHIENPKNAPSPSSGWVYTIGALGSKLFTGPMFGQLKKIFMWAPVQSEWWYIYKAVTNFNGIRILVEMDGFSYVVYFYLGFAGRVKIDKDPLPG